MLYSNVVDLGSAPLNYNFVPSRAVRLQGQMPDGGV